MTVLFCTLCLQELRAAEQQQGGTDGNSDAATAAAAADADVRWRRCFVAALNAAAMRGIAATGGAAGTAGPQQHDMHRCDWGAMSTWAPVCCHRGTESVQVELPTPCSSCWQ